MNGRPATLQEFPSQVHHRIYLERDICSRLNRYAAAETITDVWVWYEAVGANSYLIYIGYA